MAESIDIMRQFGGFLVKELSALTGETWTVEDAGAHDNAWTVNLCREGGVKVFVRPDGNRVRLIGNYPDSTVWPRPESVEITASRDKSPGTIARDIVRRFLPKYLPELERVAKGNERDDASFAARSAAFDDLREVFPELTRHGEDKPAAHGWEARFRAGETYGDLRSSSTGDAFELHAHGLSRSEMRQILWVLKGGRNVAVR